MDQVEKVAGLWCEEVAVEDFYTLDEIDMYEQAYQFQEDDPRLDDFDLF
jgi:hypothetical protein